MSQDYSFSWSVGLPAESIAAATAPAPAPATPELIAFAPCSRHPLPDNQVLLTRMHSSVRAVVTGEVLHALGFCTTMRTLRQHAATIAEVLPQLVEDVSDAEATLQSLKTAGLFVSSRELEQALANAAPSQKQERPTVVCVPTCDRPELLERVLGSLFTAPARSNTSYFVIEDSRNGVNIAKNRQITQQLLSQGHEIHYFGLDEQDAVVDRLKQRLPDDEDEVGLLLGREFPSEISSYGRVFNHALLLSKGSALVYVDDDVLCQGYPAPKVEGVAEGVVMDGSGRNAAFYAREKPWEVAQEPGTQVEVIDPVDELSGFVGCSIPEVLDQLKQKKSGELSVEGISSLTASSLIEGKGSVMVTVCGLYGDPGTEGHQWLYNLPDSSLARLTADEQTYRNALSERNVWMGQSQAWLSNHHSLLSVAKSVDNTRLLPPLFPVFRNEDFLFAKMLTMLYPDGYFLELPWAVPHVPVTKRSWPADMLDKPSLLGFSRCTGMYLMKNQGALVSQDPASRLRLIGDMLIELGSSDLATLHDEVSSGLTHARTSLVTGLDRRLRSMAGAPEYLRNDMIRQIQANQQALFGGGAPGPFDVFEGFPGVDPLVTCAALWRGYGKAIHAWERILRVSPI